MTLLFSGRMIPSRPTSFPSLPLTQSASSLKCEPLTQSLRLSAILRPTQGSPAPQSRMQTSRRQCKAELPVPWIPSSRCVKIGQVPGTPGSGSLPFVWRSHPLGWSSGAHILLGLESLEILFRNSTEHKNKTFGIRKLEFKPSSSHSFMWPQASVYL
jgi:hypothetical protein